MNKFALILMSAVLLPLSAVAEISLDYCLERAEDNYPLIKKYGLLEKTSELNLSDINKSWLPRIGVYGQVTAQNVVPEFPETLKNVLAQMGQESRKLGNVQYKAAVDVSQNVWDGGTSKAQRAVERASSAESQAALAVQIYAVREKVMNLYFGILLMDEQIAQTENTISLLRANHTRMESMVKDGVAMQSDADMIEAQMLSMTQQLVNARSAVKSYREVLSIYTGENLENENLEKPQAAMLSDLQSNRPELGLFDAQTRLNAIRRKVIDSSLMPRVGLFAQAYYGYPGFNYFESMINRKLSFNVLAGVKISWNIDSFYTKKNSLNKLALATEGVENDREVFLFNTGLQTCSQTEAINGLREAMEYDEKIVILRGNVRKAAESQLKNGVIDATALLSKITDENQALLTAAYHEIQLIQNIYKLKNTINR